jgi:methyl coenzyme M reductase subunit C-like uncharacterized protein (methanogenesis marker protein 7)
MERRIKQLKEVYNSESKDQLDQLNNFVTKYVEKRWQDRAEDTMSILTLEAMREAKKVLKIKEINEDDEMKLLESMCDTVRDV